MYAQEPKPIPKPIDWRANLAVVWLSQFIGIAGFSCSLPFMPLYIKSAGLVPADRAVHYASLLATAAATGLMVMSPIWGALADRFGRKAMLIRANLGGAVALYLMGVVDSIGWLLALRALQGAFTGTSSASQTLISVTTPANRQSFALGWMSAAVAAGTLMGQYGGAWIAKAYSPVVCFKVSGMLLLASTLLVVFGARENFVRPVSEDVPARVRRRSARRFVRKGRVAVLELWPLMAVILGLAFASSFDAPVLTLFVEKTLVPEDGGLLEYAGVAAGEPAGATPADRLAIELAGKLLAIQSVGTIIGALAAGWRLGRGRDGPFVVALGLGAAAGMGATALGGSFASLAAARALFGFCASGLASATVIWIGRASGAQTRGSVFGWSVTARSLGWCLAPLAVAAVYRYAPGFGAVFWTGTAMFTALTVALGAIVLWLRRFPVSGEAVARESRRGNADSVRIALGQPPIGKPH